MSEQRPLLIVWNDSYLTGIKIIDEQHRGLVSIINSLYASQAMPNKLVYLKPTVEMVAGYTKIHFSMEIELLKMSGYPRLQEHQVLHSQIIADINRSVQACLNEGGDPTKFGNLLKEWILVHVLREDKAYAPHLLEYFRSRQGITVL